MVCALALLMFGLTGPAAAQIGPDAAGVQYRLPDGSFASLCQPGRTDIDGTNGIPGKACRHCDLCGAGLPHALVAPSTTFVLATRRVAVILSVPLAGAAVKTDRSFAWQSRGPPLA
jgi:hypothetical protein